MNTLYLGEPQLLALSEVMEMGKNKHKYEYRVDLNAETAAAKVVRFVGMDKRVLEVGPGPGSITRLLQEFGHCQVTAIELDPDAIEKVTPFCSRVYQCDLNDPGWPLAVSADGQFQVIVAADVLEHLHDPTVTLIAMKTILAENGHVVISLPHVGHNAVVACLVDEDFDYQDYGLLDKTHIRFFGIKNIQRLFDDAGFKIVEAEFVVKSPEQTEFGSRWRSMPEDLKLSLACNPFGTVYQVVVKATPRRSLLDGGLKLYALPVPAPVPVIPSDASIVRKIVYRLKNFILPYLSLSTRVRLNRLFERLGIRL